MNLKDKIILKEKKWIKGTFTITWTNTKDNSEIVWES